MHHNLDKTRVQFSNSIDLVTTRMNLSTSVSATYDSEMKFTLWEPITAK